jgi:hypothetical protein
LDPRPRLVCIPSNDAAFAAHAHDLLAALPNDEDGHPSRAEFERRLRERYPSAVVRAQEPLARLHASDAVTWYATNRTYRSRISAIVDVAAPQPFVFEVYVRRFPEWQVAVELEPIGPDGGLADGIVGSEFAARYELFGRGFQGRFRVIDADPPHSVRVEATGTGGIRVWYATSFSAWGAGTRVHVVGDYDVPLVLLPRVQRLVLGRVITRDIDRVHAALRELCEREATAQAAAPGVEALDAVAASPEAAEA